MKSIKIEGSVLEDSNKINHDEFLEEFINFVESKGWSFIGTTDEIEDNEKQ
ncbi:hypothetical protein ABEY43_06880 [Priestia megaterium]